MADHLNAKSRICVMYWCGDPPKYFYKVLSNNIDFFDKVYLLIDSKDEKAAENMQKALDKKFSNTSLTHTRITRKEIFRCLTNRIKCADELQDEREYILTRPAANISDYICYLAPYLLKDKGLEKELVPCLYLDTSIILTNRFLIYELFSDEFKNTFQGFRRFIKPATGFYARNNYAKYINADFMMHIPATGPDEFLDLFCERLKNNDGRYGSIGPSLLTDLRNEASLIINKIFILKAIEPYDASPELFHDNSEGVSYRPKMHTLGLKFSNTLFKNMGYCIDDITIKSDSSMIIKFKRM